MLEPHYNDTYNSEPGGGDNGFSHVNRKDLAVAGGWALFLAIISMLGLLYNLYTISQVLEYVRYLGPSILIFSLVQMGITIATIYWYIVFYNSNREIGQGNTSGAVVDRMTLALLAIFRIWGVLMILSTVYILINFISGVRYL